MSDQNQNPTPEENKVPAEPAPQNPPPAEPPAKPKVDEEAIRQKIREEEKSKVRTELESLKNSLQELKAKERERDLATDAGKEVNKLLAEFEVTHKAEVARLQAELQNAIAEVERAKAEAVQLSEVAAYRAEQIAKHRDVIVESSVASKCSTIEEVDAEIAKAKRLFEEVASKLGAGPVKPASAPMPAPASRGTVPVVKTPAEELVELTKSIGHDPAAWSKNRAAIMAQLKTLQS